MSLLRLLRLLGSTICHLLYPVLYEALKERASSKHTTVSVLAFQHGVKAKSYIVMGLSVISCMFSYPRNKYVDTS